MKTNDNYVPYEYLLQLQERFNKQEGQKYPCSNQIVLCGIFTNDRDKAINFMKGKTIVDKRERKDEINWFLDNGERWLWRKWNENCRGYRFYKVAVDNTIDKNLFRYMLVKSDLYCCSMEII